MGMGSVGKTSAFGSTANKSSNFGSTASKTSTFGSTPSKTGTFGAVSQGKESSRAPSFLGRASGKVSSGIPSTSQKSYEPISNNPKNAKSSTSFGIIWLPGRKRNKKKDLVYSSINYDKKNDRTPTMYNIMSGDSPDYQLHKKKDEEANLLVPEKMRGPIATAASAGAAATIVEVEVPSGFAAADPEEKLLTHDKEESKEAAGDSNKDDDGYLENKDVVNKFPENKQEKSSDKVDSVYLSPPSGIKPPPPQSTTSNPDEDDCIVKCLYYTIQCCDCVLM